MYACARSGNANARQSRDLLVAEFINDPHTNRCLLLSGELCERLPQPSAQAVRIEPRCQLVKPAIVSARYPKASTHRRFYSCTPAVFE